MQTGHRYHITVAQVLGRPDISFSAEATLERDKRGGRTLVFRRDDDTTFEVLAKCVTTFTESEAAPTHNVNDVRRWKS